MIIKNIIGQPIFLGWIPGGGVKLANAETIEINDNLAFTAEFKNSINAGAIEVISYNSDPYDVVVQEEIASAIGTREFRERLVIGIDGQTIFSLSEISLFVTQVKLFLNSLLQSYGLIEDYYVNGANEVVWNDLDFTLKSAVDKLDAIYDISP